MYWLFIMILLVLILKLILPNTENNAAKNKNINVIYDKNNNRNINNYKDNENNICKKDGHIEGYDTLGNYSNIVMPVLIVTKIIMMI